VKEEILAGTHAKAFERGLLRGLIDAGLTSLADGTPAVAMDLARTARVAHRIAADQLHLDAIVLMRRGGARGRRFLLAFSGGQEALANLTELPPQRLSALERRGYVAGLFLAAGSLTPPSTGYLFELRLARPSAVAAAEALLEGFGLLPHRRLRREYSVVYLRGGDQLAEALTLIHAQEARLRLEDVRSVRSMRGTVNRLVNAESANVEKSVRAAIAHGEWIRRFAARRGLESLPPKLRAAAQARLDDPEAPLEEIGRRLGLTKAGIHYRLRRIAELARSTEDDNEDPGRML
jgi:DNA-binding protein WhiA